MKLAAAIFLLLLSCVLAPAQAPSNPVTPLDEPTPQQLRILPQPDSPLRIVSANATWIAPRDRSGIQIYIVVENVSEQLVRTYATSRGLESTQDPKSCLGPPGRIGRGLRPGQQAGTSTWQGVSQSNPAPAVWIDFVELADGSRWGANACQIGDKLDGERTGARAQRDQLLRIFREHGRDSLMEFINSSFETARKVRERGEQPQFPLTPPAGHSREWEQGYSEGAARIIQQVMDADRDFGAKEVEHVLMRPIEPSEKKLP